MFVSECVFVCVCARAHVCVCNTVKPDRSFVHPVKRGQFLFTWQYGALAHPVRRGTFVHSVLRGNFIHPIKRGTFVHPIMRQVPAIGKAAASTPSTSAEWEHSNSATLCNIYAPSMDDATPAVFRQQDPDSCQNSSGRLPAHGGACGPGASKVESGATGPLMASSSALQPDKATQSCTSAQ